MELSKIKTLEDLEKWLREFKNVRGEAHVYDFGAVVSLWLSLMDNMKEFSLDAELEDLGSRMTPLQHEFLARLAEYSSNHTDEAEEKGD